jgi:hypothetical protein
MSAEAAGIQPVAQASVLHLISHGHGTENHPVAVGLPEAEQLLRALCLGEDYELS